MVNPFDLMHEIAISYIVSHSMMWIIQQNLEFLQSRGSGGFAKNLSIQVCKY